jgi:hypothetical protein
MEEEHVRQQLARVIRRANIVRQGITDVEHAYANSKDGREAFMLKISALPNQITTDELTRAIPAFHEILHNQEGLQ